MPQSSLRIWIWIAFGVLAATVAWYPVIWQLVYSVPFAFLLLLFGTLALYAVVFGGPLLFAVPAFWYWRRHRLWSVLPMFISLLTTAAAFTLNTTDLWLNFNDWYYDSARRSFIDRVADGESFQLGEYGGVQTIQNSDGKYLSLGGGPAFIKMTAKGPIILFVTFWGIPDSMSGFLYAPPGLDPRKDWPELPLDWVDPWDRDRHVYRAGTR